MKTLKTIMLGLVLLVVCGVAKANPIPEPETLTKTYAVNTYINAITRGKLDGFNDVLDQSVKFSMLRGSEILCFDKKQMVDFMKKVKNIQQACTTSIHVVESGNDVAVIRVDMKFENFMRSNYVTIANTPNGWKITNVHSVFK
jgi:hypothetical protein